MMRLDKYLELNDTINSIINYTVEENETIEDIETEALMWEKMWDNIEQVEKYYERRFW